MRDGCPLIGKIERMAVSTWFTCLFLHLGTQLHLTFRLPFKLVKKESIFDACSLKRFSVSIVKCDVRRQAFMCNYWILSCHVNWSRATSEWWRQKRCENCFELRFSADLWLAHISNVTDGINLNYHFFLVRAKNNNRVLHEATRVIFLIFHISFILSSDSSDWLKRILFNHDLRSPCEVSLTM